MTLVSSIIFNALSHGTLGFASNGSLITTYFKESDWLLKNFHHSENGSNSYHGERKQGYHVREHQELCQKVVKSGPAFCLGPRIEKTNSDVKSNTSCRTEWREKGTLSSSQIV